MDHPTIIRIACLQLEAKPFYQYLQNKENIFHFIETATQSKPDLIVLPECVFPGYFLSQRIIKSYDTLAKIISQFREEIKGLAKKHKTFIAIGIPEFSEDEEKLFNSAILINDNGQEIGTARKSFLWHFDHHWFDQDDQFSVFDTKLGKIGMFVCADGRLPEITRILTLKGANILLDLTNWVTNGLNKQTWSNPQAEYMIPTRALENKIWIVAANKVGIEEKSIQFCGKSAFFSPQGKILAMASSDQEEILIQDIDLSQSSDKEIDGKIDLVKNRRPELYQTLSQPTSKLPVIHLIHKPMPAEKQNPLISLIQFTLSGLPADLDKIEYFFFTLLEQGVNVLVFSQNQNIPCTFSEKILDLLKKLTKKHDVICSITLNEQFQDQRYKTSFLIDSGKIKGQYRKTHLEIQEKNQFSAGDEIQVYDTRFGNIGMMIDYEGFFPEIARILTLNGAEMIIWSGQFSKDEQLKLCQSRSAENKIYVICPNSIQKPCNGHSIITSPSGQIIAGCLENTEVSSMAKIFLKQSRDKMIVPNTDAILGRHPEAYKDLNRLHEDL